MANFELLSYGSADQLATAAACAWLAEIEAANRAGKPYCVALSGGRIAQKFFAATVDQAVAREVSFARVHFYWADERCVPPTNPDSNYKVANELLFAPLNILEAQIHRLRGEIPSAEAVEIAEMELRKFAMPDKNNSPVLDLIFLGVGEDGHVASLFPNSTEEKQDNSVSFLAVNDSPKPPPSRISMTYATLKTAKNVWILASGAGKEKILRASLASGGQTPLTRVVESRSGCPGTKIFSDLDVFNL